MKIIVFNFQYLAKISLHILHYITENSCKKKKKKTSKEIKCQKNEKCQVLLYQFKSSEDNRTIFLKQKGNECQPQSIKSIVFSYIVNKKRIKIVQKRNCNVLKKIPVKHILSLK